MVALQFLVYLLQLSGQEMLLAPMAFEKLEPYRAEILQLRAPGPGRLSFSQLAEHLRKKYQVLTTPGTLCRYVKQLSSDLGPRELSGAEEEAVDTTMLFAELLAEVRGRGEEQRRVLEQQAGEIRVLAEMVAELQRPASSSTIMPEPEIVRSIWLRAFLISAAVMLPLALLTGWIASRF